MVNDKIGLCLKAGAGSYSLRRVVFKEMYWGTLAQVSENAWVSGSTESHMVKFSVRRAMLLLDQVK